MSTFVGTAAAFWHVQVSLQISKTRNPETAKDSRLSFATCPSGPLARSRVGHNCHSLTTETVFYNCQCYNYIVWSLFHNNYLSLFPLLVVSKKTNLRTFGLRAPASPSWACSASLARRRSSRVFPEPTEPSLRAGRGSAAPVVQNGNPFWGSIFNQPTRKKGRKAVMAEYIHKFGLPLHTRGMCWPCSTPSHMSSSDPFGLSVQYAMLQVMLQR